MDMDRGTAEINVRFDVKFPIVYFKEKQEKAVQRLITHKWFNPTYGSILSIHEGRVFQISLVW